MIENYCCIKLNLSHTGITFTLHVSAETPMYIRIELGDRLKTTNRLHRNRKQAEYGHDYDFAGNLETEPD